MQTVADVSTCPSILYDETDPEPPKSRSKAGQHLFETGEAHVLQAYPLRIVSLWKGGGNCSCNLPVSEQSFPGCFFKALDVFVQKKICCCSYCQFLTTTVTSSSLEGWGKL